jgi:MFS family permease
MSDNPPPAAEVNGPIADQRWLTAGVAGVGASSLFSDTGHEMTTAVLPGFLTATLHAGPGALGLIEGVSDALMGLAKLAAGPPADDPSTRARLASGGYLGTAVLGGAIGIATGVWQVAVLRAGSWVARGLRSPARDALLATLSPRSGYGRAYGLERAGDNLGAVFGPLLAALLVAVAGVRVTLLAAAVPGVFAAAAITVAARQARRNLSAPAARRHVRVTAARLQQAGLIRALLPALAFECGNVATTLLILRATDLLHTGGRGAAAATSLAIVLYAAHNAVAAGGSLVAGALIDKTSPRLVLAAGAGIYIAGYLGFALGPHGWPLLLVAFALSGAGIGLAEPAQSTLVAHTLPDELRGSGFGVLGLVQAGGDLLSTSVVGLLWAGVSPVVGFCYAAAWMAVSLATALRKSRVGTASNRRGR